MARNRMIKPEIWTDAKFIECSMSARLLFISLLNFADDNGLLQYFPKQIKCQCMPIDNVIIEDLIDELIKNEILFLYDVDGKNYLWIINFTKHQTVNRPSFKHPLPPSIDVEKQGYYIVQNQILFNDRSMNIQEQFNDRSTNKDKRREVKTSEVKTKEEERVENSAKADPAFSEVVNFWNSKENLHQAKLTNSRRAKLKARLADKDFSEGYKTAIEKISASKFCTGENDRGWKATFDWLLANDTNYVKVLEGKYDNHGPETEEERDARLLRELENE